MFTKTLLPNTLRAIKQAAQIADFQTVYLAGGTALALQIGHRISVDLDFFTTKNFDERILTAQLENIKNFSLERAAPLTLLGKIGQTRVSLFAYKYPLIEKPGTFKGLSLAGKKDIAAMKINALENRGTKRDFIDLFFLAREFSLEEMIKFYNQKYKCLEDHLYGILKSFSYFEDAERNEMPRMLAPVDWKEIKEFFVKESQRLAKSNLIKPTDRA